MAYHGRPHRRPKKPVFADLADLDEDTRIKAVGKMAMKNPGKIVGMITDDEPDKPERYIRKLKKWFKDIVVIDNTKGPAAGMVTIRVRAPEAESN